jgi:hypothetical protein
VLLRVSLFGLNIGGNHFSRTDELTDVTEM